MQKKTGHDLSKVFDSAVPRFLERQTPGYLYAESEVRASCGAVRDFWNTISPSPFHLFYSVKANPNPYLLKLLGEFVDGFDVSSVTELRLVQTIKSQRQLITWSGPAKTDEAFVAMLAAGIHACHLDSYDEIETLLALEKVAARRIQKTLRLQLPGAENKKLGFSERELARLTTDHWGSIFGFHLYLGRDEFSVEALAAYLRRVHELSSQRHVKSPEIFLGPGLATQPWLPMGTSFRSSHPIHIECGRALIQNCGRYITQVIDVQKSAGPDEILLAGGRVQSGAYWLSPRARPEDLIFEVWRSGQKLAVGSRSLYLKDRLRPASLLAEVRGPEEDICPGDWVVIGPGGAYGLTAGVCLWETTPPAEEWLVTASGQLSSISPWQRGDDES